MKSWYSKNNYNLRKQLFVNNFCLMRHHRCLTGFRVSKGSQYTSALNMPGFCICFWFCICQGFENTECAGVIQGSGYVWIFSIVKKVSSAAGFLARFAHFSSQPAVKRPAMNSRHWPWSSMLGTLEIHRKSRQ